MNNLTKKGTKTIIKVISICLALLMMAVAGVGSYFIFNKKPKEPKTEENSLAISVSKFDGKVASEAEFLECKNFANRGENTFTINSAETFVYFVNLTNSEPLAKNYNYFKDYKIYLNTSIDLNGYALNPIGIKITLEDKIVSSTFQGSFDGGFYSIYNTTIKSEGLFSYVENAEIKNIGLYNVKIKGEREYVGGVVGTAVNTNISSTYVRLGKISGPMNVGGIVGEFVSNNGENHKIENSFVDTTISGKNKYGLCAKINTNNQESNGVEILNSYHVSNFESFKQSEYVTSNSVDATQLGNAEFDVNNQSSIWTNYTSPSEENKHLFNYPILKQFNKVFNYGCYYEGVYFDENNNAESVPTLSYAFSKAEAEKQAKVLLIVANIFVDDVAVAGENVKIEIISQVDTTILRGNNESNLFVGLKGSELVFGGETSKAITIEGRKDVVEQNNLKSGSVIVSSGNKIEFGSQVVLQNNINNTTGNGGGIYINNATSQNILNCDNLVVKNCKASNGGGIYVDAGTVNLNNADINTNTAINNGGGLFVAGGVVNTNDSTAIYANNAENGAGVYVAVSLEKYGSLFVNDNTAIYANSATKYAGGIFRQTTTTNNNYSAVVGLFNDSEEIVDEAKIIGMFTNYLANGIDCSNVDNSILNKSKKIEVYADSNAHCTVEHILSPNAYGFGTLELVFNVGENSVERIKRYDAFTSINLSYAQATKQGFNVGLTVQTESMLEPAEDVQCYALNSNRYPVTTGQDVGSFKEILSSNSNFVYSYSWFEENLNSEYLNYTNYNQNSSFVTLYNVYSNCDYVERVDINVLYTKEWKFFTLNKDTANSVTVKNYLYSDNSMQELIVENPQVDNTGKYKFLGWSTDLNTSVEFNAGATHTVVKSGAKTKSFYAVWGLSVKEIEQENIEEVATVRFHFSMTKYKDIKITNITPIIKTSTYTKLYCVFDGENAGIMVETPKNVYTRMEETEYGEAKIYYSDMLQYAVKEGYSFEGWSTLETSTYPQWSETTEFKLHNGKDGNFNYYAVWGKIYNAGENTTETLTHTFNISADSSEQLTTINKHFYTDGIKYFNYNLNQSQIISKSEYQEKFGEISFPKFAREGFNFVGWSSSENNKVEYYYQDKLTVKTNTTWYAVWSKNWTFYHKTEAENYLVKYVYDSDDAQTFEISSPTKENATLVGYTTDASVNDYIQLSYNLISTDSNPTYFAVWKSEILNVYDYEQGSEINNNSTSVEIYHTPCKLQGENILPRAEIVIKSKDVECVVYENANVKISANINNKGTVLTQLLKLDIQQEQLKNVLTTATELVDYEVPEFAENGIDSNSTICLTYADAYVSTISVDEDFNKNGICFNVENVNGLVVLKDNQTAIIEKGTTGVELVVNEQVLIGEENLGKFKLIGFVVADTFYSTTSATGEIIKQENGNYLLTSSQFSPIISIEVVIKEIVEVSVTGLPSSETIILYSEENCECEISENGTIEIYKGVWKIANFSFLTGDVDENILILENIFGGEFIVSELDGLYFVEIN